MAAIPKGVKPVIFGPAGTSLSDWEKEFFKNQRPFGFILFGRNCENPDQLKALIADLKVCTGRADTPILIDQEGGRVQRLQPPHWKSFPPAGYFAAMAEKELAEAEKAVYENARAIGSELKTSGFTVNCAPMADLKFPESNDAVTGDRAFGSDPAVVVKLARAMAKGLSEEGITPVLKHIPGHGRAQCDSHQALPIVDATLRDLNRSDFRVFHELADLPWGMTAHIVYSAIDTEKPATLSKKVIQYIRETIGFKGLLLTDDISMKALAGDLGLLAKQALEAGCDIVLHCNGKKDEMERIANALKPA